MTYRDVYIVDGAGELTNVYNLTTHDLSSPEKFSELLQIIKDAAVLPDEDNDQLSDLWERQTFGNLTTASASNPDQLISYALGDSPADREPSVKVSIIRESSVRYAQISFTARLGAAGGLTYAFELSENGIDWKALQMFTVPSNPPIIHYDGSAMQTLTIRSGALDQTGGMIRIRAGFPSP